MIYWWILFFIGAVALFNIFVIQSKVGKIYKTYAAGETGENNNAEALIPTLGPLMGKPVKIIVNEDCEIMDLDYFTAGSAVKAEIIDFDETWIVFRYTAPRYEKVPENVAGTTVNIKKPVKGAEVTQFLRITDIESIDEVTDEN